MDNKNTATKAVIGITIVVVIALLGVVGAKFSQGDDEQISKNADNTLNETTSSATAQTNANSTINQSSNTDTYKDGTYAKTVNYQSPGGIESISVTITVSGGTVSNATISQEANNRDSEEYQSSFRKNYQSKVVGKKLSELNLSIVSGASLTTEAFNDGLNDVRSQAKT